MDYCSCDGESADVYRSKIVKARKQHICNECKEVINVGEEYKYISYLMDGDWSHLKICEFCQCDDKVLSEAGMCISLGNGDLKRAWKELWEKKPKKRFVPHPYLTTRWGT